MRKIDNQIYDSNGSAVENKYLDSIVLIVNDYVDRTNIFREQYINTNSDTVKEYAIKQYNEMADNAIKMLEIKKKFFNIFDNNGKIKEEELILKVKPLSLFSELYNIFEEKTKLEDEWKSFSPEKQAEKEQEYKEKFMANKNKLNKELFKIKKTIEKIDFCINSIQTEKNNPNTLRHPSEYQPLIEKNDDFVLPKGKIGNVNKKRISKLGVAFILVGVGTMIALPIVGHAFGLALATGFGAAAATSTVGSVMAGVFGFGGFSLGSLITYGAYNLQKKMTESLNTSQNIAVMTQKEFKKYIINVTSDISKAVKQHIAKDKSVAELKDLKTKCKWRIKKLRDSINEDMKINSEQNMELDINAKETAIQKIKELIERLNQKMISLDPNVIKEPFFRNLEFTDEELYGMSVDQQDVPQNKQQSPVR